MRNYFEWEASYFDQNRYCFKPRVLKYCVSDTPNSRYLVLGIQNLNCMVFEVLAFATKSLKYFTLHSKFEDFVKNLLFQFFYVDLEGYNTTRL